MSMITDNMMGELNGYNMYKNTSGMYYYSQLYQGYFIQRSFDTIGAMKKHILTGYEPNSL